jgi:LacI family transcriptional regulator
MASIMDVARRARVSPSTVSHALNRTRFVAADTRARVDEAVAALGYRPNAVARTLRSGRSHTLGLVLPDSANPFFAELGRAIELAAFEAGFSVILCNTENDADKEQRYVGLLTRRQVDGLVLVSAAASGDSLRALAHHRLPVVAMDRERPDLGIDTVLTDHLQGGWLATRHLLALGHRRIGCITGPADLSPSALRLAGYRRALVEAGAEAGGGAGAEAGGGAGAEAGGGAASGPGGGAEAEAALVRCGDFHPESGRRAALELLGLPRPPTAIFACNDLMAFGVLRAAAEVGRRVPQDLALVGYDDIVLSAFAGPPLTTVSQPCAEMGRATIGLMVRRIGERMLPPQQARLPAVLRVRQSCGGSPADAPVPEEARGGSRGSSESSVHRRRTP